MKRSRQIHRTPANLSESVQHQLSMYALAASAAGVGMLALAEPAEAKIVYTSANQKVAFCEYHTNKCLKLDLNHDKIVDFTIPFEAFGDDTYLSVRPADKQSNNRIWGGILYTNAGHSDGSHAASALSAGVTIGSNSTKFRRYHDAMWGSANGCGPTSNGCTWGQWKNVQKKYLGLKFYIKGQAHYGWARLNINGYKATLTGYAYETTANKSIVTGKTKGPDVITVQSPTLGHLAQGASAVPAGRVKPVSAAH